MSFDSELYAKKVPWVKRAGIVAFVGAILLPILGACGQKADGRPKCTWCYHTPLLRARHTADEFGSRSSGDRSGRPVHLLRRPIRSCGGEESWARRRAVHHVQWKRHRCRRCPLHRRSRPRSVDRSQAKACSTVLRSWVEAKLSPSRSWVAQESIATPAAMALSKCRMYQIKPTLTSFSMWQLAEGHALILQIRSDDVKRIEHVA